MPKPKVNFNRSVGAIAQKKENIERRVKEEEAEEVERLSIFKLKASEITILPELEKYIRKQSEDEAIQFKDSIKNEGIRDNLVITSIDGKNVLVDGHHRFRAGQEIGINDFSLKKIDLGSIDDIKLWMLKNQLGRRNLTDAERGDIALSITDFLTAKGLENKSKGGKNEDFANLQKVNAVKEASKIAGISEGNISKLKKLKKEAPEEVYSQVLAGEKSIHKAHTELKSKNLKPNKEEIKLKNTSLQEKMDGYYATYDISEFTESKLSNKEIEIQLKEIESQLFEAKFHLENNDRGPSLMKIAIMMNEMVILKDKLEAQK